MQNVTFLGEIGPAGQLITLYESLVPAGFPSPALDHMEQKVSLDALLNLHAPHTYLVRVSGDSLIGAGIFDRDLLVVDRSLDAGHGDIVVASINGEMLVKRFLRKGARIILASENPAYPPRHILEHDELAVWGVVRHSIRCHGPEGQPASKSAGR